MNEFNICLYYSKARSFLRFSSPGQSPVSPSWKGSVEVLLVDIVSALNLKPIRVDTGHEKDVGGVNDSSDPRVVVVVLGQVSVIKSSLIPGL